VETADKTLKAGQELNMNQQGALLEASQRLITAQALRGFLIKLNMEHLSYEQFWELQAQKLTTGGGLTPEMQKNLIDLSRSAEVDNISQFIPTIKQLMDVAAASGAEPNRVPAELQFPIGIMGGYQGNPDLITGDKTNPHADTGKSPPPAAIQMLLERPDTAAVFDVHYGEGSGEAILQFLGVG
jgi:hypothetical protein